MSRELTDNFIVVDTEGKHLLREIAIVNSQGQLIYEAFAQEGQNDSGIKLNCKPLKEIIADFVGIASSNLIICHNANHDRQVLKNTFKKVGIDWQPFKFKCSLVLAQNTFPGLLSYSLEYLSKQLTLKVKQKYFHPLHAHAARYDAEFTYQLYRKIMEQQSLADLKNKPNPFASSRVDTPFQTHPDLKSIYQGEFERVKSVINDIKYDHNHQSKGVVIIGEPGSGKTHLIMRLAQELLKINRLLFIRCPNNPATVLYHIYSRILESFIQEVPATGYTQLEHLLAHSFVKLISRSTIIKLTQKDREIQETVRENPLNLYKKLEVWGAERKREIWDLIKRRISEWWLYEYGAVGYSLEILTGIIQFCRYTDPKRKQLVSRWLAAEELSENDIQKIGLENWTDEISKEEFSLQAISVFSKLSLLDEPLIIVFDQLESLSYEHRQKLLLNFGEAVKEIFTHVPNSLIILNLFPDRWKQFQQVFDGAVIGRISQQQIYLKSPSPEQIKGIIKVKLEAVGITLSVDSLFSPEDLEDILHQNSIRKVLNRAAEYYNYKIRNIPVSNFIEDEANDSSYSSPLEERLEKLEQDFSEFKTQFKEIVQEIIESNLQGLESNLQSLNLKVENLTSKPSPPGGDDDEVIITPPPPPPPSTESQKIIEYLRKQKELLEEKYTTTIQFISDNDDLGKLLFISEAFQPMLSFEIEQLNLGKRKIPEHLVINKSNPSICIGFLQVDGVAFTARISNFNELVNSNKNIKFILWRDVKKPSINGKVGKEQIAILNNFVNGEFRLMEKEDRINFELIYQLIMDIENKDFEVSLEEALKTVQEEMSHSWIIQLLTSITDN
ncbi:Exonuclease RNase T and DNA polymerase III [Gloeothece citriformis PCC 7424]|uniref:Exonuclease RNase T and DNA polymerase III n=1 Tax=Gloeothece citriformis (strain PCC 7424) TaxID=65393 RepID=B7K978_GLOC7|nr:DNA polymerase III [Gloeothece citriformis]ACK68561.1 Exonuclease RNase T and DNA polymerase III [Gloeothece citriformis PCC 7424]